MSWYRSGTVAVAPGDVTVTGTGTAFSANGRVGDAFQGPDGRWYEVTNIASATVLSILPAYQGDAASASQYGLAPMQGYVKESADRLREITAGLGSVEEDVAAAKDAAGAAAASAAASATAAQASEREAAQDCAAAAASAAAASGSQVSADGHRQAAQAAAEAAQGFRDTAGAYRTQAGSSATAAAASAAAAKQSEQNTANKAGSGANSDITSLHGLTTALSVSQGGTGSKNPADARTALGLKSAALADILGSVSQSGGVPTGAIIQSGANAQGEFIKYADGTMICTGYSAAIPNTSATNAYYGSACGTLYTRNLLIYLPVAFADNNYRFFAHTVDRGTCDLVISPTTATCGTQIRHMNNTQEVSIHWMAIGRWFV